MQVGDKVISLAPNSSAFHIALLMRRHDIAKSIIEYVKKQHSKHLMDELCKPNQEGYSNLHIFVLCDDVEIQKLLYETKFLPTKSEFENPRLHPINFCIRYTCPIVLEYLLSLSTASSYKQAMQDVII